MDKLNYYRVCFLRPASHTQTVSWYKEYITRTRKTFLLSVISLYRLHKNENLSHPRRLDRNDLHVPL